jgi:hypothetical protein
VAFADLPTFDDDELEERASRFLTERLPAGIPIPIPIEWLVESLPGVDFDCHPALRANHAVDGGVWAHPETAGLLVSVDEGIMDDDSRKGETHYRWTVAEQLAHLLIHRDAVARLHGPEEFLTFHNAILGTPPHRNAQRLAGALLMPPQQLATEASKVYEQLVRVAGTDNAPAIHKYLRHQLGDRFKVSERAMGYRLTQDPLRIHEQIEEALRRGRSSLR